MPKRPRRQNLKPPGRCIFCGGGAVPGNPMSREHLWSDWMTAAKLLPHGGEHVEVRNVILGSARISVRSLTRTRQGEASTKKRRTVCQRCNNGWMSDLEESVQPILTPLIKGEKITLFPTMLLTLMQWLTLKVLVAEHNFYMGHPADPIFDQAVRTDSWSTVAARSCINRPRDPRFGT